MPDWIPRPDADALRSWQVILMSPDWRKQPCWPARPASLLCLRSFFRQPDAGGKDLRLPGYFLPRSSLVLDELAGRLGTAGYLEELRSREQVIVDGGIGDAQLPPDLLRGVAVCDEAEAILLASREASDPVRRCC